MRLVAFFKFALTPLNKALICRDRDVDRRGRDREDRDRDDRGRRDFDRGGREFDRRGGRPFRGRDDRGRGGRGGFRGGRGGGFRGKDQVMRDFDLAVYLILTVVTELVEISLAGSLRHCHSLDVCVFFAFEFFFSR